MTRSTLPVLGEVEERARPAAGDLEQRDAPSAAPTMDGPRLRGLIPYGVESRDLGGWREVIERGALANANTADLVATVDHGGVPIGRHPGTLTLEDGEAGMGWSLELPESRSDVREAVSRGDLCAGSWRMIVARDEWRGNVRHVHEISELRDVSVVSSPAYSASVVEHRSAPPAGPTPGPAPQRRGLRVEERTVTAGTPEDRVLAAMSGVAKGEARDITRATVDPVEPADLRTALIDRLRASAVMLQAGASLITTDRKEVTWPVLTGDVTTNYVGELEPIPESDPAFGDFTIVPHALKTLTRGSAEAFADSDPDLLTIVRDNILTSMVLKADRELVAGTGPIVGIMNTPGAQAIDVAGALSWDHVLRAVALLAEAQVPGPYAMLLGPRPALGLSLTKETTTSAAYLETPAGVPPIYSCSTLPVTVGAGPKTTAIVFAPSQATVVLRKAVEILVDRSQEFTTDAVLVRGVHRIGLGVAHSAAVVKLTNVNAPAIA